MTIHTHDEAYEPAHTGSQTAHALDELQLYGYRPFDEPDPRPMPDGQRLAVAVADIFDALVATLEDTRMEPDLEEVLWGQVNLFHRATARIERLSSIAWLPSVVLKRSAISPFFRRSTMWSLPSCRPS